MGRKGREKPCNWEGGEWGDKFVDDNVCVNQILRAIFLMISDSIASTHTVPNLLSATVESASYTARRKTKREREIG
jgi:hypothetical protein